MVKCVSNEFQRDFKWISKQRSEKEGRERNCEGVE